MFRALTLLTRPSQLIYFGSPTETTPEPKPPGVGAEFTLAETVRLKLMRRWT